MLVSTARGTWRNTCGWNQKRQRGVEMLSSLIGCKISQNTSYNRKYQTCSLRFEVITQSHWRHTNEERYHKAKNHFLEFESESEKWKTVASWDFNSIEVLDQLKSIQCLFVVNNERFSCICWSRHQYFSGLTNDNKKIAFQRSVVDECSIVNKYP